MKSEYSAKLLTDRFNELINNPPKPGEVGTWRLKMGQTVLHMINHPLILMGQPEIIPEPPELCLRCEVNPPDPGFHYCEQCMNDALEKFGWES